MIVYNSLAESNEKSKAHVSMYRLACADSVFLFFSLLLLSFIQPSFHMAAFLEFVKLIFIFTTGNIRPNVGTFLKYRILQVRKSSEHEIKILY